VNERSHRVYDPSELGRANRRPKQAVPWRQGINKIMIALSCTLVALLVAFFPLIVTAQTQPAPTAQTQPENQSRRERGDRVINKLSGGAGQPVLTALRQDFPFLADAITDYSLGEVWSRRGLDDRTRQLATVAAFAAQGNLPQLKIHAGYALRLGATQDELKEIVYLTTVTAGFPRSIDAAQALREVFAMQRSSTAQ
jgi:4-carboxymuconolactone decarboxylase